MLMEYILRTHNLTKKYKDKIAVNKVNMNIKKGEIYGFLGENGAGKTTVIRMIMGLIKESSGSIELFGKEIDRKDRNYLKKIGSIIEFPGFYTNLTAYENLDIHRKLMGISDKKRISKVLKIVNLDGVENKKIKEFSLGMKQRLGIGRALLHQPELLILDEPTNGLDPSGIKEIRQLIIDLANNYGITVLVSSHILSEIEQMANIIGIIHHGKLLEEIDYKKIEEKNRHYIQAKVSDDRKAAFILEQKLSIKDFNIVENGTIRIYEKLDKSMTISRALVESGVDIGEFILLKDTLEEYFLKLTRGNEDV